MKNKLCFTLYVVHIFPQYTARYDISAVITLLLALELVGIIII